MKKRFKRLLYFFLVLIILFVVLGFAFFKRFVVTAPDPDFPSPATVEEAQTQDLAYLSIYPSLDRSFDTVSKKQAFANGITELKRRLPLAEAVFEMEVAKLVAIADNAHTNVSAGARARRLNAVPLRMFWFEEGLHIIMAQKESDSLLGKRIVAINDRKVEDLLREMEPFVGGATTNLKYQSPLLLMSPEQLYGMGLGASPDSLSITIEGSTGEEIGQFIKADTLEKDIPGYISERWLSPAESIKESGWKSVSDPNKIHFSVSSINDNVHHQWLDKLLYVQVNENFDDEVRKIKDYLNDVSEEPQAENMETVVLDLRFNPGGDYHKVRPFIKWTKKTLSSDQKMFVITSNGTFSAGIITVALAKDELGNQAVIVGEAAGDHLQFWADGGARMTLPNSRISVYIWTAWNDWKNGCKDWSKCFWIAIFDGVGAGNIDPDHLVPLRFVDFINGRDSVMDFIIQQ